MTTHVYIATRNKCSGSVNDNDVDNEGDSDNDHDCDNDNYNDNTQSRHKQFTVWGLCSGVTDYILFVFEKS